MTKEHLKELRGTELATNQDGDFVFVKRTKKGTKTFGPYTFKEAMIICWAVMDDYKEGIEK